MGRVTSSRILCWLALLALALAGCRMPMPLAQAPAASRASAHERALFAGTFAMTEAGIQTQAIASDIAAGATVSLIDPATAQVKGTGLTDAAGNFTVMALSSFTPALNTLYVLEASKPVGGAGAATLALRTLVSLSAGGWTSVSGTRIAITPMTTAVVLVHQHKSLVAADVLGKVSYDPVARRSQVSALNAFYSEIALRQVAKTVQEALASNLDPMQVVKPKPDGTFGISFTSGSLNLLANPSFEDRLENSWALFDGGGLSQSTVSLDPTTSAHLGTSVKYTVKNPGDTWLGQANLWWINPKTVFTFRGGETYTFSVYAKGAAGNEKMSLMVAQSNGDLLISTPISLTTDFRRYHLTYTATSSAEAQVFVRPGSLSGQAVFPETLWLDGAQLEVGAAPTGFAPEPGKLLYDSTTTPASASSGITYGPGYRGGQGVVLDSGINLIPNGHARNGLTGYVIPNGGTLSTTTAHGLPPNPTGSQTFLFTHDASINPNYPLVQLAVKPHTTYTLSAWVCAPSAGNPASFELTYGITEGLYAGRGVGTTILNADDTWRRVSFTFTSGPLSSLYAYPVRMLTANAKVAFTMFQVEEGATVHPYTGDPTSDRFALDDRYVPRQKGSISFWLSPFYDSADTRFDGRPTVPFSNAIMGISQRDDQRVLALYKEGHTLGFGVCTPATWYTAAWTAPGTLWTAGSWHHVAMTWGGPEGMVLYFDGRPVATNPYSGGIYMGDAGVEGTKLGNLFLSGATNNATYVPNATFDRVRVHDYPRSAGDVAREALGIQHSAGL